MLSWDVFQDIRGIYKLQELDFSYLNDIEVIGILSEKLLSSLVRMKVFHLLIMF